MTVSRCGGEESERQIGEAMEKKVTGGRKEERLVNVHYQPTFLNLHLQEGSHNALRVGKTKRNVPGQAAALCPSACTHIFTLARWVNALSS